MALLKLSGMITKISGKVGGSVLGTSNSGAYIKQNAYAVNKNSVSQQSKKSNIGSISAMWRSLSPSQQQDWKDMAPSYPYVNRVGDTVEYTGYALFLKMNNNLKVIGVNAITTPLPPVTPVINIISFGAFENLLMRIDWTNGSEDNAVIWYASPPLKNNLVPHESQYRQLYITNPSEVESFVNLYSYWNSLFTEHGPGDIAYVYGKVVDTNTGDVLGNTNIVSRAFV